MSEHFTHKHIHSVVWLITIILAAIIVAGVVIILLTGNAPVATIIPEVFVEPVDSIVVADDNQARPRVSAGKVMLKFDEAVQLGDRLSIAVHLDTESNNINIAKIALDYDPAILQYEGFDKNNTVLPLQFRDEAEAGKVVMSRGAPGDADPHDSDDGYTGSDGLFGSFQFTALRSGTATIGFDEEKTGFYLDDGQGSVIYPKFDEVNIIIN